MREERFSFQSRGEPMVGTLYRPDGEAHGAVVTTGPLTSVKEQASGAYARALAERGYAALAFDHRGFGQSGGLPRQFETPQGKAADIAEAITALSQDERTAGLRAFAVGICAGGGYMAQAVANDWRVRGFAGVAGVYPNADQTRSWMGDGYQRAIDRARAAEKRWRETGYVETIPAVAPDNGDVAMPLTEAYEFYGTQRGTVPNYVNGFAVQSRAYTLPFDVQRIAGDIRAPTIVVHSEKALAPSLAHRFFDALTVEKEELWLQSQGQIDFYDDAELIGPAADAIDNFFRRLP
ncbi:MAG: alpha/beta fold hydrolase [Rhizobiaceae bacterium]|nr:alpha/beta fold hydrolase [Rhizobiaceae bacterium]MCV0405690.1 alpha/beta fold hydrolase [Rhizobiaceae bacterium]